MIVPCCITGLNSLPVGCIIAFCRLSGRWRHRPVVFGRYPADFTGKKPRGKLLLLRASCRRQGEKALHAFG